MELYDSQCRSGSPEPQGIPVILLRCAGCGAEISPTQSQARCSRCRQVGVEGVSPFTQSPGTVCVLTCFVSCTGVFLRCGMSKEHGTNTDAKQCKIRSFSQRCRFVVDLFCLRTRSFHCQAYPLQHCNKALLPLIQTKLHGPHIRHGVCAAASAAAPM